jgi:hypothetical protein
MVLSAKEQHRLFFQLALPVLVLLEDRFGTGTERSEIEEYDVWVEKELGR